ncbi:hypothetical protein B0T10DRAFT_464732 [Thelonectria olida]|uniref:Uncharacterized protein n=1 Tax=Thelonectria olida TaxID=1576542 RepID=A0A9P8VXJ2_9HYPO|nr:hypothetical protein B0T10DRAFT_464732 [Thelonectria olida]
MAREVIDSPISEHSIQQGLGISPAKVCRKIPPFSLGPLAKAASTTGTTWPSWGWMGLIGSAANRKGPPTAPSPPSIRPSKNGETWLRTSGALTPADVSPRSSSLSLAKKTPIISRGQLTHREALDSTSLPTMEIYWRTMLPSPHPTLTPIKSPSNSISTCQGGPIVLVKSFAKATSALDTSLSDMTIMNPSSYSVKGVPRPAVRFPAIEARDKTQIRLETASSSDIEVTDTDFTLACPATR